MADSGGPGGVLDVGSTLSNGASYVPARVQRCRHKTCRRARRCLRPQFVPGREPDGIPSCPLVTDEEWAGWRAHLNRMVTIRLDKLFELEMEEARRQASRRRR